jgi:hypothetical protein
MVPERRDLFGLNTLRKARECRRPEENEPVRETQRQLADVWTMPVIRMAGEGGTRHEED